MREGRTIQLICQNFTKGAIITPKDLINMGINRSTAYTFPWKHSDANKNNPTTIYFKRLGRGRYQLI
jgi:hypothetical protein